MAERKDLVITTEDYPSNSFVSKEPVKETKEIVKKEKIVKGKIKRRKKPAAKQVTETIFEEDARSVGGYLLWDVILPAIKNLLLDVITNGSERMLFGGDEPKRNTIRDRDRTYVSYASYYDRDRDRDRGRKKDREGSRSRALRAQHNFEEVVFDTRRDAENVLSKLVDIVDEYGQVSVADFYDFVGITAEYTDRNWGWDNLGHTFIEHVRDGFIIVFPRTIVLD